MALRVLTWNLMHGRAAPPAGRDLLTEFGDALSRWEWDVAALQEVPPWWPALLGKRLGADHRLVRTSRNFGLPVRRAIAIRWPDLIKSNGGGCNAILSRGSRVAEKSGALGAGSVAGGSLGAGSVAGGSLAAGAVAEHRTLRLRLAPERRWLQGVRLVGGLGLAGGSGHWGDSELSAGSGLQPEVWVGNLHATVRDADAAVAEARLAARALLGWAAGAPAVLGGDFNVRKLSLEGFVYVGGFDVDHVFAHGLSAISGPLKLDRGHLSDHAPVVVSVG